MTIGLCVVRCYRVCRRYNIVKEKINIRGSNNRSKKMLRYRKRHDHQDYNIKGIMEGGKERVKEPEKVKEKLGGIIKRFGRWESALILLL